MSLGSELALKGITTKEEALGVPAWVIGTETRHALLAHDIQFELHEPVGWDVHLGARGPHGAYMGAHTEADAEGHLVWRACTERNALRGQARIEAHGGEVLHHPFHLDRDATILQMRLADARGEEHVVLTMQQDALFNDRCTKDIFGNKLEHHNDNNAVTVTSPGGHWARFLLEGYAVAGIRTPLPPPPARNIVVNIGSETFEVEVPGDHPVTLGMLLAGRTRGSVRVQWDGKTETLAQRDLWSVPVQADWVRVVV